jgi:hypothetical protein
MMDFTPLAFHLEQTEALNNRLRKINEMANSMLSQIGCTCDFTEQGQHVSCPQYTLIKISQIASKTRSP